VLGRQVRAPAQLGRSSDRRRSRAFAFPRGAAPQEGAVAVSLNSSMASSVAEQGQGPRKAGSNRPALRVDPAAVHSEGRVDHRAASLFQQQGDQDFGQQPRFLPPVRRRSVASRPGRSEQQEPHGVLPRPPDRGPPSRWHLPGSSKLLLPVRQPQHRGVPALPGGDPDEGRGPASARAAQSHCSASSISAMLDPCRRGSPQAASRAFAQSAGSPGPGARGPVGGSTGRARASGAASVWRPRGRLPAGTRKAA